MGEVEMPWNGGVEIMKDIRDRWPMWMEMAKRDPGRFKSSNSLISMALISYGITALLHSQVRSMDVSRVMSGILDLSLNRSVLEEIWGLQRNREEILTLLNSLLMSQGDWLRQNPWPAPLYPPERPVS
jgi:hypothetical protein